MFTCISDAEARKLLAEAINLSRLKSISEFDGHETSAKIYLKQIHSQLQDYTYPIEYTALAIEQIPLKIRRCFVRAVMLLTFYPQLGGKETGGTYFSSIVSSYKHDFIPRSWYKTDALKQLCRLFKLSATDALEIQDLLNNVEGQIKRQQEIIRTLISKFNQVSTQKDTLNLFQTLFGNICIPEASINCLITKMQIIFLIDYQQDKLQDEYVWCKLSTGEQQDISQFLNQISQFSFQKFTNFPSFGCSEAQVINPQLSQYLVEVTGYNQSEIINAITSSITIVPTSAAESFLVHDIWGHYWQSILTHFGDNYHYLSQVNQDLSLNSSIKTAQGVISLQELFKLKDEVVQVDNSLAKKFFQGMAKKRWSCLSTHLIGEMLADINEYKWLFQNQDIQDILISSSCFKKFPTKLDLTIKDLESLFIPTLETLIKLSQANLETELINEFKIKDSNSIISLRQAICQLNETFLIEYLREYQSSVDYNQQFSSLFLNLIRLQNILNKLYTEPIINNSIPWRDLILLFVSNYYSASFEQDVTRLNLTLANYFVPCCLVLNSI